MSDLPYFQEFFRSRSKESKQLGSLASMHMDVNEPGSVGGAATVIQLVAKNRGMRPSEIRGDHRLLHDLSIYGDDAEELIVALGDAFKLDPREFDFDKYFFGKAFAYWLFFGFLRRRMLAPMKPLTVEDLILNLPLGRWPV